MQRASGLLILLWLFPGFAVAVDPLRLTMDEAVARAAAANPEVKSFNAAIQMAEARLRGSSAWLPSNPYFSGGAGLTSQPDVGPNFGFFLSQEFEIAGQREKRN